jgi:hypothetical protein
MIEMSPSRVARATKMTPATSRGVPVFLPPNTSGARKSDFVYFPPTPDAEETDLGSVVLHKPSRSMTDLAEVSGKESKTFTAVVHGKVKETTQKPKRVPETPHKAQRSTILEAPLSPGQGELAALLQGALWLEDSLDRGELPSDTPVEAVEEEKLREEARRVAAEAEAKAQEEEKKKIAIAKAQLQAKRDEPTSGRLKHTFLIPLTKARSVHHRKEVSSSKAAASKPREDQALHPKSAGLPDKSGAGTAKAESAAASATQQSHPRATTPESKNTNKSAVTPPKSPKTSRFASFRRLGSISRPSTVYSHPTRHSESVSSEDSVPVVTPPENNLEFGTKKSSSPVNEFGQIPENGSTTSFPSISPKKSVHSLGRATSFAERIWSRARTKSSGSNLSATSENAPGMHLLWNLLMLSTLIVFKYLQKNLLSCQRSILLRLLRYHSCQIFRVMMNIPFTSRPKGRLLSCTWTINVLHNLLNHFHFYRLLQLHHPKLKFLLNQPQYPPIRSSFPAQATRRDLRLPPRSLPLARFHHRYSINRYLTRSHLCQGRRLHHR